MVYRRGLHAFHAVAAVMLNAISKHSCLEHGIVVNFLLRGSMGSMCKTRKDYAFWRLFKNTEKLKGEG